MTNSSANNLMNCLTWSAHFLRLGLGLGLGCENTPSEARGIEGSWRRRGIRRRADEHLAGNRGDGETIVPSCFVFILIRPARSIRFDALESGHVGTENADFIISITMSESALSNPRSPIGWGRRREDAPSLLLGILSRFRVNYLTYTFIELPSVSDGRVGIPRA